MPMRRAVFAALALAALSGAAGAQVKALRFARVVDGTGRVIPQGTVLVEGDRVTRVLGANDRLPDGAQVIDLRRYSAIPGLIDVHTHMTYTFDAQPGATLARPAPRTPERTTELLRQNLMKTLETGVT